MKDRFKACTFVSRPQEHTNIVIDKFPLDASRDTDVCGHVDV